MKFKLVCLVSLKLDLENIFFIGKIVKKFMKHKFLCKKQFHKDPSWKELLLFFLLKNCFYSYIIFEKKKKYETVYCNETNYLKIITLD